MFERSKVGIFLCHSPNHAASVPLILNTQTGMVSPQFHIIFDDNFGTVSTDKHFSSLWQRKAKFQTDDDSSYQDQLPSEVQAESATLPPHTTEIPAQLLQIPQPRQTPVQIPDIVAALNVSTQ